ncbi:MAG: iron-sulfur cluster carrier protein ApbC [Gammaproteobacteria bacterium]|nr:iron-sulfur cluster carrier protein ApbC [Gammaproteobacteria bacterium]
MTGTTESVLKSRLAQLVVPYTNRPLGAGGTNFEVHFDGGRWRVDVACGFPLDASKQGMLELVQSALEPGEIEAPVDVEIECKVETHAVQSGLTPISGVKNIIAIASGKGGVGKSTVAANVALALVAEGAKVGMLDADIYGPSQPRMLNLLGQRPETKDGKTLEPLEAYGIVAMSIGFLVDDKQAVAWRGPMVTSALNQMLTQTAWGELDYLIVDMPPGTGDVQLTLAQKVPVSGAVIVTTPQDVALSDARKGLEMFRKVKVPLLGIIENMSVHVCSQCGHEDHLFGREGGVGLGREYDLPLLGALPLQRAVREQADAGTPTVVAEPDAVAARMFRETALRVAGELAATPKSYSHLFGKIAVEGKQ